VSNFRWHTPPSAAAYRRAHITSSHLSRESNDKEEDKSNHLNAELNPICQLLALLGAHHIFHVSSVRVKGRTGFSPFPY
jgi:hypothetical protein